MKGYTTEQWQAAEKAVRKRASQYAYQITNHIDRPDVQKKTFELLLEGMVTGARIMQEEIENLTDNDKQETK